MEFTSEQIEPIISEVINLFLIPRFLELNMESSGEWINNVEARGNQIWGRDYTEYLVDGRPPNTNQDPQAMKAWVGWAGSTVLNDWVRNKGLNISPYAVAWKIAREGNNYYPNGTDLLEVLESEEVRDYITERLGRIITVQVQQEFNRQFR